jgi:perosamine synthetase
MAQLEKFIEAKLKIEARYDVALKGVTGITPMREAPWAFSTFWMSTVLVDEKRHGRDSRSLMRFLAERGIETRPLWQPLHRSKAHRSSQAYRVKTADILYRSALSLPSSVGLTKPEIERVIDAVTSGVESRPVVKDSR